MIPDQNDLNPQEFHPKKTVQKDLLILFSGLVLAVIAVFLFDTG